MAKKYAERPANKGLGFRVAVEGAVCSGFTFWVGFDGWREGDTTFEFDGLDVYMDKGSARQLQGVNHIDYHEAIMQSGFVVTNKKVEIPKDCGGDTKCRDKPDPGQEGSPDQAAEHEHAHHEH